jgi:excinuclease ABC subunit C
MYAVLELINKLYKPRTCRQPITKEGIKAGKYQTCLEYHIKNCLGPCVARQTYEDYQKNIAQAREILKGNTRQILRDMRSEMEQLAEDLRFEEAEEIKRKYLLIDAFVSKSEVVSHTIDNVDVFSITNDEKVAYINYIHVSNGSINQSFTFEYKKRLNETEQELLQVGIIEMRDRFQSRSKEIVVPVEPEMELENVTFTVPQRGDKKTLLDLSLMNGKQYKFDRLKQAEKLNPEQKQVRLMKELQEKLGLPKLPYQIECFDNSNISGTDAVAASVVFKGMKPSKKDYKKYNIKTVVGPDDYASMKEVVHRRYTRLLEEEQPLPDLIIADGGKGQMGVIREVIQDELNLDIPIAGLAKNDRHRTNELLYGFPPLSVQLKTDSELFHMLTQIQDEVHRFAITFHREKRSKRALESELDNIKGIGPKTRDALLNSLKSLKKIREADIQTLEAAVGPAKAQIVYNFFHHDDEEQEKTQ